MNPETYAFDHFTVDGVVETQNPLIVVIDKNKSVEMSYKSIDMGSKIGSGSVSAQAAAGETVSIVITKPDLTTEVVTALTDAGRGYSVVYTGVPGDYTAIASVAEDALYLAATSSFVPFTIGKDARSITLTFT